ncbi:MAG: OmpH family outer membrane protein [Sphingobacteriia bacterium]|nr:OmpH family outer membrane protein [Sphingobacteriia bacterium]
MKVKSLSLIILTLILITGSAEAAVNAANYIVMDIEKVIYNSNAAQDVRKKLEQVKNKFQQEIEQKEQKLKAEEDILKKEQQKLSPEAFEKKVRDFQTRIAELQRGIQIKRGKLEESYEKALNQINEEAGKIIVEIAQEKKADLVLPTSQILFAAEDLNMSEELAKRLNKRISKVNVDVK